MLEGLDIEVHQCALPLNPLISCAVHWLPIDTARLSAQRTLRLHMIFELPPILIPPFLSPTLVPHHVIKPALASPRSSGPPPPPPLLCIPSSATAGLDAELSAWMALTEARVDSGSRARSEPTDRSADYAAFVRADMQGGANRSGDGAGDTREVKQGYWVQGASLMPLLPYTRVWLHRTPVLSAL
ncbi:hypothetical protein B0H13DRAFT_775624 [Mycena leptocephala]|nr:hypothetical protein B0H13DRAFT_775624 [Mycena leptocephala]